MQDRDPASLLFISRDEYGPLYLDPELFESVGDGVSQKTFVIPKAPSEKLVKSSSAADLDPLDRLKSLADKLSPQSADEPDNNSNLGGDKGKGIRIRMGTAQSWESAWEQDLDQRVLDIERRSIFDTFCNPGTSNALLPDTQGAQSSPILRAQGSGVPEDVNLDTEWKRPTVVDFLSHSAGTALSLSTTKDTLNLSFDLPSLSKRPRNILDDCLLRDQVPKAFGTINKHQQQDQELRAPKVAKRQSPASKANGEKEDRVETWRAAGKPVQDDLTGTHGGLKVKKRLIQEQLSWETCSNGGHRTVSSHHVMSPYVTEAGTATFESVYQKHMGYAFKFRPSPTVVPYKKLIEHVSQESIHKTGFYLPQGPDLLTMIYTEILEQPSPSDPLWLALLLSILDQASKPYRDILSRWMGITPSARGRYDTNQVARISATGPHSSGLGLLGFPGHSASNTADHNKSEGSNRSGGAFSIFDSYLQQSLQGLDPFGEFFVHSRRGWTWDGSQLIVLSDPLEYNGEFRMSDTVSPARFLDEWVAKRIMEAGKELQILVEFQPRHPLIAHDRKFPTKTNWLRWFYVQDDLVKHRKECAKAQAEVLSAVGTRLESMGWISKETIPVRWTEKQARDDVEPDSELTGEQDEGHKMDIDVHAFERYPGQGSSTTANPGAAFSLDLGLDPDLLGFFSLSSTLGQTKDMTLACPNMMSFLLEPTTVYTTANATESSPSVTATERKQIRLDGLPLLTVLAERSLCYTLRARASLINTCVMSLYFHDLNLLGHLEIMERFLLMRDGWFVARLGEALFEDETGLLMRYMDAANEAANEAAVNEAADSTTRLGTGAGVGVGPSSGRRGSAASTSSNNPPWRRARLTWPPRSGEVEMTLRAVLLDCFQANGAEEVENFEATNKSDLSEMEVGDDAPNRSFVVVRDTKKDRLLKRKKIDSEELEETLAFAVQGYDEESTICRDANALEALDFLYLDYKAPRPLRLLVFTTSALQKYTRLFTFQLRLARVGAAMKQIYRHLRTRQKLIAAAMPSPPRKLQQKQQDNTSLSKVQQARAQLQVEMRMLHRFKFETQQIFDGLQGYIVHVAMGQTWEAFMDQMRDVQRRVEDRIIARSSSFSSCEGDEGEEEEERGLDDLIGDLTSLRDEHDKVLDQMLLQSLLKRKQAPILKIVHGILNCLLRFFQMVTRLQSSSSSLLVGADDIDYLKWQAHDVELEEGVVEDILERQRVRIEKLQSLQDKFRGSCRMLVKVLKVLDERGVGGETASKGSADAASSSASGGSAGFLPQLLLRLDMFGFNDN
ncbi:hypothetical protein EC991_001256 [Linnemannia zychae]|nr:hypothetical protein EC991_001256 [Linnemannia zychae]